MNIVTIGGGDMTPAIKKSLELAGDPSSVLVIPSASSTETSFNKNVGLTTDLFKDLGVDVDLLHNFGETPSETKVEEALGSASLVFTIGGNTPHMIARMQEHGTDKALKAAIENGTVHAGWGSGALLPFNLAHSNVEAKPKENDWDYEYLAPGIDSIKGVATVLASLHDPIPGDKRREDTRLDALMATFPEEVTRGFGLDRGASAVFGDNAEIILTKPEANVHYVWRTATNGIAKRIAESKDLA